jgi:hypothetical protein
MKNRFLILSTLAVIFLSSCEDPQNPAGLNPPASTIINKSGLIYFSTFPQSEGSVQFLFPQLEGMKNLSPLFLLNQNGDTLAITPLVPSDFHKYTFVGHLDYDFQEDEFYQLRVNQTVNKDTVFVHQLPDYKHVYKSGMGKNSIASFERLNNFDLSPDRKFLFLNDFKDNIKSNFRLELNSGTLLKLEDELGWKIRAVDKNRLLHVIEGFYESEILLYDVEKKTSVPFGITRGNGGNITTISDGHLVFTNPVTDGNRTLTVVNLQTDERRVVSDFAYGYSIREDVLGQMIFGNSIFEIESGTISEELTPFAETYLLQYNPENDFVFFKQGLGTQLAIEFYRDKFVVGKRGEQPAFDSGLEKNVVYFLPSETRIINNKFLVYIDYGVVNDEHRVSGFYQVDLSQGTKELVHSENQMNIYKHGLIQLEDNLWMTIFSGEISFYQMN